MKAKKKFGQNFLVSPHHLGLLDKSVGNFIEVAKPKHILEVGPGLGALTQIILKNTNLPLECWEIDPEAVDFLQKTEYINKIDLIQRDALDYLDTKNKEEDFQFRTDSVLISNLPYNVGSRILIELALLHAQPLGFLVMLQKEVGLKLLARDKNINLIGAFLRIYYEFKIVANFPRSAFSPQPNVESVLVQGLIKNNLNLDFAFSNKSKTLTTLKKLLIYPSKTLANNLKNLDWDKEKIEQFLEINKLDKNIRLEWENYIIILGLVLERLTWQF